MEIMQLSSHVLPLISHTSLFNIITGKHKSLLVADWLREVKWLHRPIFTVTPLIVLMDLDMCGDLKQGRVSKTDSWLVEMVNEPLCVNDGREGRDNEQVELSDRSISTTVYCWQDPHVMVHTPWHGTKAGDHTLPLLATVKFTCWKKIWASLCQWVSQSH
jgi:hypothetical protein